MSAETTAMYLQIALGAGALLTMIAGLLRYTARKFETFVSREIQEATKPIHPDSNGGLSLADVARGVDELKTSQGETAREVSSINARMDKRDIERAAEKAVHAQRREEWRRMLALQGIETPH